MAVFAVSVQAQEGWTLRQCIDYAIEHNISIRQSANTVEQSAVSVNTAKWARLPNLNGSAGQSWNWGRTQTAVKDKDTGDYSTVYVNTSSNSTDMSLSTNIPIFTGLEIPNQYALAKLNLKAAMADLEKAKEDISINIASAYLLCVLITECLVHRSVFSQLRVYYIQKLRAWQNEPSPQKVSIYAVFLELTSLSSFLYGNCYCSTNHWVITHEILPFNNIFHYVM